MTFPFFGLGPEHVGSAATMQRRKPPEGSPTEIATLSRLPSLGSNAEAHGVNDAGTVVVGHSFDRAGFLYAVKWTIQNGSWVIARLPYAGKAALANGADNDGDVVGWVGSFPRFPLSGPGALDTLRWAARTRQERRTRSAPTESLSSVRAPAMLWPGRSRRLARNIFSHWYPGFSQLRLP